VSKKVADEVLVRPIGAGTIGRRLAHTADAIARNLRLAAADCQASQGTKVHPCHGSWVTPRPLCP